LLRLDRDDEPRLPGRVDPAEHAVLRPELGCVRVLRVGLNAGAPSDLEVAPGILEVEDQQAAGGTLAEVARLPPRPVEPELQLPVFVEEPHLRELRTTLRVD